MKTRTEVLMSARARHLATLPPVVRAQIEELVESDGEAWVAQNWVRLVAEAEWAAYTFDERTLPRPDKPPTRQTTKRKRPIS